MLKNAFTTRYPVNQLFNLSHLTACGSLGLLSGWREADPQRTLWRQSYW